MNKTRIEPDNDPRKRLESILEKVNPLHDLMLTDKKISHEEHIKTEQTDGISHVKQPLSYEAYQARQNARSDPRMGATPKFKSRDEYFAFMNQHR